jgi:hypothetical protein
MKGIRGKQDEVLLPLETKTVSARLAEATRSTQAMLKLILAFMWGSASIAAETRQLLTN